MSYPEVKETDEEEKKSPYINADQGAQQYGRDAMRYMEAHDEAAELEQKWREAPNWDALQCPICLQIMRDPVCLNDNKQHTFCKGCIKSWLRNHRTNPLTNMHLTGVRELARNEEAAKEIKELYIECQKVRRIPAEETPRPVGVIVANSFYDENLKHLAPEYEKMAWVWEGFYSVLSSVGGATRAICDDLRNIAFPSDIDQSPDEALSCFRRTRQELNGELDRVEAVWETTLQNGNDQQRQQVAEEIGFWQQVLGGIKWFINKTIEVIIRAAKKAVDVVVDVVTWPFKKMWQGIKWLFGW